MKKILIFFISAIVVYIIISIVLFFNNNTDVENVVVQGYIYDELKYPVDDCRVVVFNSTYKQKDNDYTDYSSYLGNEVIETSTDKKGYYNIKLDRSAFVLIRVYKKKYKIAESEGLYSKSHIDQSFILNKGFSKESDLFKKATITEEVE